MILYLQDQVSRGLMTLNEMNDALRAEWGGSYNPNRSGVTRLSDVPYGGITGTRANGTLIGRDYSNSFTRPPQNTSSRYDQINQREQETEAGLDAEIAALGPQNLRPLPEPGGGFGAAGSGYRQGPLDTYGYPPPASRGGPTYPDMSGAEAGLNSNPSYGLGHYLTRGIDAILPLPNYVREGIGAGLDNPDGWWRNLFRQMPPPTGSNQPDNSPVDQNAPYNPGFGQPRDTAPRASNNPPNDNGNTYVGGGGGFGFGGVGGGGRGNGGGGAGGGGNGGGGGGNGGNGGFINDVVAGNGGGGGGGGGGNGGNGMGRNNRNRQSAFSPDQLALLQSITGQVQGDISGGEGFGLDPLAQGAYNNFSRQFGQGSEFGRLGEEAGLKLLRGEQLIPYSDPGREQFYKEAFLDPATANFRNDILPDISEAYAGRGLEPGRSGDLLNAEMTAGRRLATDLGAQRAGLLRGDQDRALLGLGQAFNAAAAPNEIAFNVGQQNRFLQNPYSNPAYGVAPLALGTQPYVTRQRGGSNRNSAIGAGVGAAVGLAGNYLSGGGGYGSNGGGIYGRSAGW